MVSRDHFISLNKLCLYKNDVIWRVCPWFDIQIRRLFSIKAIFHPFVLHVLHLFPHLKLLHTFLKRSKSFKPFLCCHWRLSVLWRRVCGTKSLAKVKHWHFISCLSQHSNCLKKWTMHLHVLKESGWHATSQNGLTLISDF